MRYAITGGAGFIGSHLAKHLLAKGHAVDVVDNLSAGMLDALSDIKDKIQFHKIDICNPDKLDQIFSNKDGVFHLAALTSVRESYKKEKEYNNVNVTGTENVLKTAKKHGIKVVFASSSGVYGDAKVIPTPESAKREPVNPYGITKLKAELLAEHYSDFIDVIGLRYYNVYGKGGPATGVIARFYRNIEQDKPPVIDKDGTQRRDFVAVNDIVDATLRAMQSAIDSCFINIGSGTAVSILDLANMFLKYSGKTNLTPIFQEGPEGNIAASQADISLAEELLEWRPQTKLKEWIERLYKQ